jgi:hypothetical protein
VETCLSGTTYDGEWKDNKKSGKGVKTLPDGTTYDGEWKDDTRSGKGVETWLSGTTYDGEWKDGKKHGKGVKTLPDGRTYESEWEDGEWTAGKWNELSPVVLPPWKEAYLDAPSSEAEKQEVLAYLATEEKHVQQTLLGLKRKIVALEQPQPEPESLPKRTRFNSPSVDDNTSDDNTSDDEP